MGYSTNSGPLWVGTLMFGIFAFIALFISKYLAKQGKNQYLGYGYVKYSHNDKYTALYCTDIVYYILMYINID